MREAALGLPVTVQVVSSGEARARGEVRVPRSVCVPLASGSKPPFPPPSQVAFIRWVVEPLFKTLVLVAPRSAPALLLVQANLAAWEAEVGGV